MGEKMIREEGPHWEGWLSGRAWVEAPPVTARGLGQDLWRAPCTGSARRALEGREGEGRT